MMGPEQAVLQEVEPPTPLPPMETSQEAESPQALSEPLQPELDHAEQPQEVPQPSLP